MSITNLHKFLIIFVLFSNLSFAYDWLYIQDPQNPWYGGQGTIEEAFLSIKPQGIYLEYNLYLTFSAEGLGYNNSDTLEVEFHFDLPQNAIVFDSWLWVEDEIIRAKILDKWTASSIYEDIVNRRKDPSILFKRGNGQYELRIFPMAGDKSRKVKISYLIPAEWSTKNISAPLPINIFNSSYYPLNKIDLITYLNGEWKNPQILEFPSINFESITDTIIGNYFKAEVSSEAFNSSLNFSLDAPLSKGIYINKFEDESNGYYQMVFIPSQALNISTSNKVAILIDYDAAKTTVTKNELLSNLKSNILTSLSPKDSFNIIISNLNIKRISEEWLPVDSLVIENVFDSLGQDQITNYSSLPALLADGIDFIKGKGNEDNIILVSSSDQVGDYQVANELINDLMDLMEDKIPIHVVNFQNQNFSYHWFGGLYYYGNGYFYENITRLTAANYYDLENNYYQFSSIISNVFQSISGFINSFDFHTKLGNGFCYGRYNLNPNNNTVYLNKPILQVGKFNGDFPFIIEASGIFKSEPFSIDFSINENDVYEADSLNKEIWTGNYIAFLEKQNQTNDIVSEIIDYSINERVLSIYSAFLCLEPSRGGEVCYDCLDESEYVSAVEDSDINDKDTLIVNGYPNPFNSEINLQVTLHKNVNLENVSFKIYDILGQLIKTFDYDNNTEARTFRFTWNGISDNGVYAASGNYIFVVTTPGKVHSMKIVLMK